MKKILSLMGLFFVMTGMAQTPDQIVNQYINALGGSEKLSSVKSIQKKDTMVANGMEFPMDTYQDKTGKIYSTMKMGDQEIILLAFDGEKGFMFDNMTYSYKDISPDQAASFKNKAKNMFGYFYEYKKAGHQLKYTGQQTKDGKKMDVVEMHLKEPVEGGIQDLTAYFDADSHLLNLIEVEKNGAKVITRIKGYKTFEGIKFPAEVVTEMNGTPIMTLKTGDVKINAPAPPADKFVKPNN